MKIPHWSAMLTLASLATSLQAAEWKYGYADLQFGRIKSAFTVSEAPAADTSGRYVSRALEGSRATLEYQPYALAGGEPPASWPVPSGYPTYATPYLEWKYSVKAGGWETVTVPAGTFKALRVVVSGERGKDPDPFWWPKQPMRFEQTFWYSPEAKRYVKSVHRAWNMNQADFAHEQVELLEYRP